MSGVWFLVRQSTPVMVPASCGEYSGAEPSGLSGSLEILRNSVSARPGPVCAVASDIRSPASDKPASALAVIRMLSRRDIFIWSPRLAVGVSQGLDPTYIQPVAYSCGCPAQGW